MSGSLPHDLPVSLKSIVMTQTRLSGSIGPKFRGMSNLNVLSLEKCAVSGDLSNFRPYESMRFVHLGGQQGERKISGTLPPQLLEAPNLISLLVHGNALSGIIHTEHDATRRSLVNNSAKYFTLSNNRFSGTVSRTLCQMTHLRAISMNSLRISGTIPECIGAFTSMLVFSIALNYFEGKLPTALNSMTALETSFVFSNLFKCNAPSLDSASALGHGTFSGIEFPATKQFNDYLFQIKAMSEAMNADEQRILAQQVPTAKNGEALCCVAVLE